MSQVDHYSIKCTLGKGTYATVKKALDSHSNEEVALKLFRKGTDSRFNSALLAMMEKESALQQRLSHENIVRLHDTAAAALYRSKKGGGYQCMYLAMELCEKGELYYLLLPDAVFPWAAVLPLFLQLLSALTHAHSLGVSHRDLKPSNLLLTSSFSLKLADFGFAANTLDDENRPVKVTGLAGSKAYAAPEVYLNAPYDGLKADIFSLGVILYNICFQARPFACASLTDSLYSQFVSRNEEFWSDKQAAKRPIDPQLVSLLNCLMAFDPSKRPNVEEIRVHPWVSGGNLGAIVLSEVLANRFADAQRQLEARKEEALRRKSRQLAGSQNRFRGDLSSSSTLSGSIGGENRTLPASEPFTQACLSLCTNLNADEVAYSVRYLASIEEWSLTEDPAQYAFTVETEEANGSALAWQVSLRDWDGVVRADCRRLAGCYFEFYAEVEKLKQELAKAEREIV